MNKIELEKLFDEKFKVWDFKIPAQYNRDVKQFIFEDIISEVLKNIIPKKYNYPDTEDDTLSDIRGGYNDCIEDIEGKIEILYGITL